MTRVVDIVDTTTRDGNQSLWGATGLTAQRHPGDRSDAGARRLPRARLHLEHAHGGVGALPSRGPVGADPPDAGGDAEHAPQLHHDRDALHRLAAVRRGRDAARLPLRRAQRDPALPVRRAGQRSARRSAASPGWPGRKASRRSWSGSPTRSAPCTRTPTTPSGWRRSPTARTSTASTSRIRAAC